MEDKFSITTESKLFALEINIFNPKENFEITKNYFKSENPSDLIKQAQNTNCDILALKFNIESIDQISQAAELLKQNLPEIKKPLMICGCEKNELDEILLPELIKVLDRPNCIISYATEQTYKKIIPSIINGNHYIVLKSPIDINLAKELNILSMDMGLEKNKIIMNTDIGGLGYGFEYGYSIMEKVRQEGQKGDMYLDLPLLSDAPLESLKTKEAKSDKFPASWGELEDRAKMIEISSASSILAAGANIIVMTNPDNILTMKGLF